MLLAHQKAQPLIHQCGLPFQGCQRSACRVGNKSQDRRPEWSDFPFLRQEIFHDLTWMATCNFFFLSIQAWIAWFTPHILEASLQKTWPGQPGRSYVPASGANPKQWQWQGHRVPERKTIWKTHAIPSPMLAYRAKSWSYNYEWTGVAYWRYSMLGDVTNNW